MIFLGGLQQLFLACPDFERGKQRGSGFRIEIFQLDLAISRVLTTFQVGKGQAGGNEQQAFSRFFVFAGRGVR